MSSVLLEIGELLRQFARSEWRDIYIRTASYSLFAAKPGGAANPMLNGAAAAEAAPDDASFMLRAPHVGTVDSTAQVGQRLSVGEIAVTLLVLDEPVEIAATRAGIVSGVLAGSGTAVEYDTPLLRLSPAASAGGHGAARE